MKKISLCFLSLMMLALVFSLLPLSLACAQLARTTGPTLSPLAQLIEGAKKEGTVSTKLAVTVKETTIQRLEKEIKAKYNVDLKINNIPLTVMPRAIANLLMEIKSAAPPSVDLITINQNEIAPYIRGGAGQKVDWKPLATEAGVPMGAIMGVPPELELFYGYGLLYFSAHLGLMYNPKVVPPSTVAKKLSDLANPRWKGQLGMRGLTAWFPRLTYFVGEDYVLNSLQAIMKNGAVIDTQPNLANRFKLGEISMSYMVSEWLTDARRSGPAEWQSLEISHVDHFYNGVVTGAAHPNAAKLVALYLASPDGYKLMLETTGAGNMLYPGNTEYEIDKADKAQGLRFDGSISDEKLWKFMSSSEFQELSRKVDRIFRGG
jgi:ABC-type Fe3+ transport system substrate-binding protein